ncbi:MAG TPA: GSCFA domain-containing protein [Lacipirellulaceae bacterium]|nr:GSCFA domain-containing protein [Lacipirellulaceae bacterium]
MVNPYAVKGAAQFWRTAVASIPPEEVCPIPHKRFVINAQDRVATAGSCFAQHVSRHIGTMAGIDFLQTEVSPADQPVFSARYGNIYTVAQLRQLLLEATGQLPVPPLALQRSDGRWVDAFRPTTYTEGFATKADVTTARRAHLDAVRRLFAECSVFIFTLGLIEGWTMSDSKFVLPVHPGVVTDEDDSLEVRFHRYSYEETKSEFIAFWNEFRNINPRVRLIITVSPVPLTATFTDDHVLQATVYSKSVLRSVCGTLENSISDVFYFPSYEIISSHFNNGKYFDSNKRTINEPGISHVMRVFEKTYLISSSELDDTSGFPSVNKILDTSFSERVICDEEKYGTNIGF